MSICATPERAPRVAIIGLGAGGLGAYRKPGQDFTFFEIDPAVKRIAENPKYFTYLSDCCANAGKPGGYEIVLGDGRLKIAAMPDGCFGLIAMDAFGSDAVPMHLLTREAVDIYVRKLAPGGVLVFNLSTRILELPPVVARIARDAGLQAFVRLELIVEPLPGDSPAVVSAKEAAIADGKVGTIVVAVVREPKDLGPLASSGEWINITYQFPEPGWTDDFSNLLEVIHWR